MFFLYKKIISIIALQIHTVQLRIDKVGCDRKEYLSPTTFHI